jgi:hypothetical protein
MTWLPELPIRTSLPPLRLSVPLLARMVSGRRSHQSRHVGSVVDDGRGGFIAGRDAIRRGVDERTAGRCIVDEGRIDKRPRGAARLRREPGLIEAVDLDRRRAVLRLQQRSLLHRHFLSARCLHRGTSSPKLSSLKICHRSARCGCRSRKRVQVPALPQGHLARLRRAPPQAQGARGRSRQRCSPRPDRGLAHLSVSAFRHRALRSDALKKFVFFSVMLVCIQWAAATSAGSRREDVTKAIQLYLARLAPPAKTYAELRLRLDEIGNAV